MTKHLPLLLFIGLAFWHCEDKETATYSIIGLWERESISLSSVDDPSLNLISLSDSSNYDFIQFNSDMSFSSYGFAITNYLNKFLELGVLLLGVSVIAEILFGPNVAFFGSQVTNNLINLLNTLGEQGIAALIIVFAVIFVYRKYLK